MADIRGITEAELKAKTQRQLKEIARKEKLLVSGNKLILTLRIMDHYKKKSTKDSSATPSTEPKEGDKKDDDEEKEEESGSRKRVGEPLHLPSEDIDEPNAPIPKKRKTPLSAASVATDAKEVTKEEEKGAEREAEKEKEEKEKEVEKKEKEEEVRLEPKKTIQLTFGTSAAGTVSLAKPKAFNVSYPQTDFDYFPDGTWKELLSATFASKYFSELMEFVATERRNQIVFPPSKEVWTAFSLTPFEQVRVVIIGQDPYFNEGQAHGLCFSVKPGVKVPQSLNRIYKELAGTIPGFVPPKHGYLEKWARQGVFMINATLTVRAGKANSHQKSGWQKFTDEVVQVINEKKSNVIYLLWGDFAQKKGRIVDTERNHVLKAPHPSPMGGPGFIGCKHFQKTNELLTGMGQPPIDWTL